MKYAVGVSVAGCASQGMRAFATLEEARKYARAEYDGPRKTWLITYPYRVKSLREKDGSWSALETWTWEGREDSAYVTIYRKRGNHGN